ncbi:MAG: HAMP domain-containing histidine kinase [Alphaproteobacteria bacterium]|nr:HAMP domain-containing histidine kinase [Alphaproteobacteria bacterium]
MSSLTRRVTTRAVAALCITLLGVGLATAVLLDARARRSLDQALLGAAFAEAHPWQAERFENDLVRSPVDVRPWAPDDPIVSRALYEEAVAQELPVVRTLNGRRVLLLVVEQSEITAETEEHPHFVVLAEAPAVTLWDAALPFLGIYFGISVIAAALAGLAVRRAMLGALAPLHRATDAMAQVQGLGSRARLERGGPEEVDRLLASTNALLDRLDAAFDAQATFTAQAAHELRTPLTILLGELDLALRRDRTTEEYREVLVGLNEQTRHLGELVQGLLALARVEAGQADRGRARERISEALHRALRREQPLLADAGNALSVELVDDPEVSMHVELVASAIANLLRNARVHAAGAPVHASVRRDADRVVVCIADRGPGVPPADAERLFERFHRGTTSREGLGIGLALAREIARRHGGDLALRPNEPHGLCAELSLPCEPL